MVVFLRFLKIEFSKRLMKLRIFQSLKKKNTTIRIKNNFIKRII
jgi:hypothetical protein